MYDHIEPRRKFRFERRNEFLVGRIASHFGDPVRGLFYCSEMTGIRLLHAVHHIFELLRHVVGIAVEVVRVLDKKWPAVLIHDGKDLLNIAPFDAGIGQHVIFDGDISSASAHAPVQRQRLHFGGQGASAASCADHSFMSVFLKLFDGADGAFRHQAVPAVERSVHIKKY